MAGGAPRSASRRMAIYLQAAFYERQQRPNGAIHCAYCDEEILPDTRCLDHVDNDPDNNAADNVLAACRDCNTAVGRHFPRGYEILNYRLRALGVDPKESERRVKKILRTPLRDRADPFVVSIAEAWFGERLEYQRRIAAERRDRNPAPRSRSARATAPDFMDEEVPF